ncbi:hypothetical protein RIVM261_053500 [Rivularia sp. IAM M-261]|nr:hypothetical protein CAL7716_007010 [Calothrix sp. PCC 7716]GJD20394.1 hypothetical protein RIVM261_053500 [Rivularia sp. IAM M-261]
MSEAATLVPVSTIISMLTAINERSWSRFKELEREFVNQHGVEVWEDVFNFRVLPALDKESNRWFLIQKCSTGIKSVKVVG